ncbi:MAG TPA: hypothetical protein VGM98_17245 [Schlesneria sp.]|jgi:hypothetical protein
MLRSLPQYLIAFAILPSIALGQASSDGSHALITLERKFSMIGRGSVETGSTTPTVSDELLLTTIQHQQIVTLRGYLLLHQQGLTSRNRQGFDPAQVAFDKLQLILSDDQRRRLDQLDLQREGALALLEPQVAEKLGLSTAQRLRIRDAHEDYLTGTSAPLVETHKNFGHACHAILTEPQRVTWNEVLGEPTEAIRNLAAVTTGPIPEVTPVAPRSREALYTCLTQPVIQAELQLTEDQLAKLTVSLKRLTEYFEGTHSGRRRQKTSMMTVRRDHQNLCEELLTHVQKSRLDELMFQSQGENSLLERDFRAAARLTNDQINWLGAFLESRTTEMITTRQNLARSREENLRRGLQYLPEEQRTVWNQMAGKVLPLEDLLVQAPQRSIFADLK